MGCRCRKLCIYRFVQETLNNAYRHAAGKGQVLSANLVDGMLLITINDNGPGMNADALVVDTHGRTRLGLAGLRYRVESLGGVFRIDSATGKGTSVTAQFKL